jgi:hypothetical protein
MPCLDWVLLRLYLRREEDKFRTFMKDLIKQPDWQKEILRLTDGEGIRTPY